MLSRTRTSASPGGYGLRETRHTSSGSMRHPSGFDARMYYAEILPPLESHGQAVHPIPGHPSYAAIGHAAPVPMYPDGNHPVQMPRESLPYDHRAMNATEFPENIMERNSRRAVEKSMSSPHYHSRRRTSVRDEFHGPCQLLSPPSPGTIAAQEKQLPQLPTNLDAAEQDDILHKVNDCLSRCAYNFVAKYQFQIPIEEDKRQVQVPSDREWTEWVHLLKRLTTTRRIPREVLYNGQIKQLITVLENSLEMRHAAKHQSRPVKDDRNVLQLISAGTQVTKMLKDSSAMQYLDRLYVETEKLINERRHRGVQFAIS